MKQALLDLFEVSLKPIVDQPRISFAHRTRRLAS
jgi:hypothetical protein